jgi:hypothetical protein
MESRTFDDLTRNLGSTLTRRSALRGLAASAAALVAGGAVLQAEDASAKKRGNNRRKKKDNDKPVSVPPPPPVPPGQPTASQNCLAAGNQCGTFANQQGTCRVPSAADAQAGFICTSNQALNTCASSNQCGANTRCVIQGAAQNCRVVIN